MDNDGGYTNIPRSPSPDSKFRKHKHVEKGLFATWKRQSLYLKLSAIAIVICLTLAFVSRKEVVQSDATAGVSGWTKPNAAQDSCRNMNVARPKIPDSRNGTLVLVTGGAGFIGSNLVDRLLELGYRVRILDNLSTGSIRNVPIDNAHVEFIFGDVSNSTLLEIATKGVDAVFHLAARHRRGPAKTPKEAKNLIEQNAVGVLNVLEAASAQNVKKVIYTSSATSQGNGDVDPQATLDPRSVSEYEGELFMRSFHNSFGLNTVVLRLDTVYGPRQTEISNPLRISKDLATLHGDSTHAYDFIHSSDVIESLVIAEQSDNLKGEVIDIGTGVGTLLQDLAKKLNLNATLSNPSTPGQGGFVADTCKMKELLGFQARRKVEEEVEKLVEEVRGGEIFMQGWVNAPKIVRSAPWILPQRAKALAWTGLEGNVKSLIESLGPHDHTVSLTLWRDEPRLVAMNHISSMVLRGHAHAYIVGASGSSLHECQKLNLPCWDVSFENGNGTQTKFKLILSLLKSGYTVHLSDINTAYQGSIQDAYSKFGNADLVVKQNIDSSFQVQSDNAFIKSNSRTIRLFESLSDNTNNEGLFESIRRTSSDKWAACFDEQQCSNISDKDQASVAFYLNPMQCTPSLFSPGKEEDRYLLVPACYEINNKKMTIVNPSAWVIRECVDQAKECSLQQTIPKNWSRGKTDNGSSSFAISWTPSYLADISVKKLLEAPWLAPKRQKIFPWQGLHNNLEGLLKAQAKEGRISITYYNKKFWKIATNCLHSMVKYGKSPNHMIASLDSETMENCMDLNLPCFNGSMLTWKNFDEGYTWTEIHWLKPILTSRVLSLGYTIHFGDTDITYIRDIWGSYSALQNRTGVDLIATDDQPYSPLNTGNVYALPTYRTKALYHNYVTLGMERPTANDQYLFHEFQHKNFKICKTRAACTEIRKVHSKELMASIFILPTPHSGCWSDGLENPADFEEYMCKSHAENFLYEHAACKGSNENKFKYLKDFQMFLMKDCDKEFDCPMVPVSWLGEKHKFLPCGPEKTWNTFPSDYEQALKQEKEDKEREEREKLEKEKEEREKKEREAREKKEREEKEKKERENKESKDN